jgi:hypothetical protein
MFLNNVSFTTNCEAYQEIPTIMVSHSFNCSVRKILDSISARGELYPKHVRFVLSTTDFFSYPALLPSSNSRR